MKEETYNKSHFQEITVCWDKSLVLCLTTLVYHNPETYEAITHNREGVDENAGEFIYFCTYVKTELVVIS